MRTYLTIAILIIILINCRNKQGSSLKLQHSDAIKKTDTFQATQVSSESSSGIPKFEIPSNGWGYKLEWKSKKWMKTKIFEVHNDKDNTIWDITYPITNKKEKIKRGFQVIPPEDILETNWDF